jgi:hypothetical protein
MNKTRQELNKEILENLLKLNEKHLDMRFHQLLSYANVIQSDYPEGDYHSFDYKTYVKDEFYVESQEIYDRMNKE